MLRIYLMLFLIGLVLPVTMYGSDVKKSNLIEKQKLICLYERIDDLLNEPQDSLVMVILTNQCAQSQSTQSPPVKIKEVRREVDLRALPSLGATISINPNGSSETLKPEDILMLTHAQLQCFKSSYQYLIADQRDPVSIDFEDICEMNKDHQL